MIINGNIPLKFKPSELQCFNWLYSVAPCFAVNSSKINVISEPRLYYETLCERFKNAQHRISIASLYVGTGPLEQRLLKVTKESVQCKKIQFKALIDYQRGTRGKVNSQTMLQAFIEDLPEQSSLSMYQTPRLQGSWSKVLPARYNELAGLQHMKLYIADDTVLLSGANCSNDYFERRQDRYIEIKDPDLADFYSELIDEVSSISKTYKKGEVGQNEHLALPKEAQKILINTKIKELIEDWTLRQQSKPISSDNDTWIFPLIQMGDFNINQDEQATLRFLATAPKGSYIKLATGYFNLTKQYSDALLKKCNANISLLMAHPNANGFLGASGPAGGIPHAYSLIAQEFLKKVEESNQSSRIQMLEYERSGWTFHAKGLWYYPPGNSVPWATIVGSANLGERSVRRDLEAQAAILTTSPELQGRLHAECAHLHQHSRACKAELSGRHVPLWVHAAVGLFRTYF